MTMRVLAIAGIACASCGAGGSAGGKDESATRLRESWDAYVARFIQADGRVIDILGGQVTTSEGQAYAMLRAVWIGDRATFDRVHAWARANLNQGVRDDQLWAWKWGRAGNGGGRVLDAAFASDADQDAALALIMAARTWNDAAYLTQARATLADLWERGTLVAQGRRYLLGGDSLCQGSSCRLNPSYYAPYAYRLFAKHDPGHDWSSLVDSSYFLLEANSQMTATRLPTDWLILDVRRGELRPGEDRDNFYSYDAFRVHWRVAMDEALYQEPRARAYLDRSLAWVVDRWKREQKLPAIVTAEGDAGANYEALEMLAALMPALKPRASDVAEAMNRRLQGTYQAGLWGDKDSYYLQNWAWFGTALYNRQLAPFELVR